MSSPNTEIRQQSFYHICRTARNANAAFGLSRGKAFISYSHETAESAARALARDHRSRLRRGSFVT